MFSRLLSRHPVLTNTAIYGALYVSAELGQQLFNNRVLKPPEEEAAPIDTASLARYGIIGTCVLPHTLYQGYKVLERIFPGNAPPMVLRKLAIDALLMTPVNISLFYVGMSAMEGKEDVLKEWKQKFTTTFITASLFWVPANFLNFRVLPPRFRVMFVGGCQIIWVSALCYLKRMEV